jgi:hypothetical protein
MVLHPPDFPAGRKQVVEMTAPPGRVFAIPITSYFCPVQNPFYATPQSPCGFRFRGPKRLNRFHHQPNIDKLNRELSKKR